MATHRQTQWHQFLQCVFTAGKRSLWKLCFHMCVSVHRGAGPRQVPPPRDQVHPLGRYTHRDQVHPQDQVHPPWDQVHPSGRYTPLGPGTPLRQVHPPGTRYTPWAGTPPGPGTPPAGTPPSTRYTPHQSMLGDMCNKRAVNILLECILVLKCSPLLLTSSSHHWRPVQTWGDFRGSYR